MAASLAQIMASIAQPYNAQRDVVSGEINALPGQEAADQAGLDTAKTNAFGDITNAANAKGMLFSGFPVSEQGKYVGEKYLSAVANLKTTYANRRSTLQNDLATIGQAQTKDAYSVQNAQTRNDIAATKATTTAANRKQPDPAAGYALSKDKAGGLQFHGPHGAPVTAAQYAVVTGANIRDLLSSSANPGDAQIVKLIDQGVPYQTLLQRFPYVFGGV